MDLVDATRVVEDALGERGLAGVDVRRDPDVAEPIHRVLPPGLLTFLRSACQVPRRESAELEVEVVAEKRRRWGRGRGVGRRRFGGVEGVEKAWCVGSREASHGGGLRGVGQVKP